MYQSNKLFALAAFFIFCLGSSSSFAQTPNSRPPEPSFDVILQTVIASNEVGKTDLAPSLSGVVKKLKNDFSFSNYRLNSTAFQRISNRSDAELRSVSTSPDKNLTIFSDSRISLEVLLDEKGQETIQVRNFRFGQRVPVTSPGTNIYTYEQIGLTTGFSLPKNTPTVVGSLATSNPNELMFLILTVKPAEK